VTVALLLLATALVVLTAGALTALLRPEGRLDAAVTLGVLAVTLVAVTVLVAGIAEVLRPGVLVTAHALQAVATLGLLRRARPGWADRATPPRVLPRWAELRAAPWEATLVALAGSCLAYQLLVALVLPPYAYDALTYHLSIVAGWVRSASLAPSELSLCCAYYPLNAELVTAWPVVLLGSDALVGVVQVLAALLAAAALAGIARSDGLRRRAAAAAGALLVLVPALLAQAPTPYVDVLLAALVLSGLHGLTRYAATARLSQLVVPGLCAGLLTGTKGTGLLWAAALGVTASVVTALHVRRGRLTPPAAAAAVGGVAAACVLLGAWWYVRAALDTGNPLHPFDVQVAGRTLFEGPRQVADVLTPPPRGSGYPWPVAVLLSWSADLLPWRQGSYDYQQRAGGLGPLWVWLGLPLLMPYTVRLWRQRSVVLVAAVPVALVLLVQPYRWWARFTLPLGALGVLAVVGAIAALRPGLPRRALQAATLVLAATGAALVLVEVDPAARATPLPAARVLGLVGAPSEERTLGALFQPEYRFLSMLPDDATVVVDLEAEAVRFVYPLFGPDLGRTVLPASGNDPPPSAWVVTGEDPPLATALARERGAPVFEERGVRVWAPIR
jgi:hypothetical protein